MCDSFLNLKKKFLFIPEQNYYCEPYYQRTTRPSGFLADGKYLIRECPMPSPVIKYKPLHFFIPPCVVSALVSRRVLRHRQDILMLLFACKNQKDGCQSQRIPLAKQDAKCTVT